MGLARIIRNHRILLKVVDTKENPWAELALQMDLPWRPGCVIPRLCEVGPAQHTDSSLPGLVLNPYTSAF